MQCLKTLAGLCNCHHIGAAQGRFNQTFDPDGILDSHGFLDLGQHAVNHIHISRCTHLRDQDGIEIVPGLFHDIDHIAIHIMRVQTIDAHGHGLALAFPVNFIQCLDNIPARLCFVIGNDGILTVKKDKISIAVCGLFKHARIGSGYRKLTTLQARTRRCVLCETH